MCHVQGAQTSQGQIAAAAAAAAMFQRIHDKLHIVFRVCNQMHHGVVAVPSFSSGAGSCDDPSSSASSSTPNVHLGIEVKPWTPPDFTDDVRTVVRVRQQVQVSGEVRLLSTVLISVSLLCQCHPAGTHVGFLCSLDVDSLYSAK